MNRRNRCINKKYMCTLQEIRKPGKETAIKKNYMILFGGHESDKHKCGKGLYISRHIVDNLLILNL
jgi:hypothetical protein